MVMVLFRGMCRPEPQYSAVNVREVKYTRFGYRTKLSRLHTLNPPFSISFSEEWSFSTPNPEQENNQGTPDKSHVPQADPPATGFAQLEPKMRYEKSN
jgi:hypothetical protein